MLRHQARCLATTVSSELTLRQQIRRYASSTSSKLTAAEVEKAHAYCDNLVRKHDYDNYLCKYFYPSHAQKGFIALRALNIELASIQEAVSQPLIGRMRMQFWRDAIDALFGSMPTQQPVSIALYDFVQSGGDLTRSFLKRLVAAREGQLEDPPMMKISDAESYAEDTASTLVYLQLEILGLRDHNADHAASHFGKTIGISTLLRSLPFHASHRRLVIPVEISSKHSVSQEDVYRNGPKAEHISDAVYEFATKAHDHLLTAKTYTPSASKAASPAFLSAVWAESYLKRLEKCNFDAFDPSLQKRDWKLPFSIWARSRQVY